MILIVGATGQLGGLIAQRLREQGRGVRALVRGGSDYSGLEMMGVEPSVGDLKDRASLERAVQGVDTVITTANSAARGGGDTVDSVEIAGNSSLIDAARDAGMIRGMPMQTGGPVTIVGEGNRRHAFVSMQDVAAFGVASVDNPAARNRQIFIGGPEPLSWNDVIARAGRLLGQPAQPFHLKRICVIFASQ